MMRKTLSGFTLICMLLFLAACSNPELPKPSPVQYEWHEQERIMFVCLDPCTWQGREYDDHSMPLERINPKALDTDQWCRTAQLWGAKEILFVAKHTGGFCWWQTETTDYGIRNTPYRNGRGDVLRELSESCEKFGLNLGIYVYPGDETWGAGIGSGGRTRDPSKQEEYNKIFRQQLRETLSNYGQALEVWFDGSCIIDISDILEEHARNTVVLQGPHASLRWPGTESGRLFYPAWNTVKNEDLLTGISTQIHGDPDGDAWAPLETNTTLYDHYWFWSPQKEEKRKSLDHLMECYYMSVGYGSVFLLNSTPDTNGLIPEEDVALYEAFGKEIERRFGSPLAGVDNQKGSTITLALPESQRINHVVLMEDYREGQRIREYAIEVLIDGEWEEQCRGQSVGRKKIDYFPGVETSKIRLKVLRSVGKPKIRNLSVYYVDNFTPPQKQSIRAWSAWQKLATWDQSDTDAGNIKLDLTGKINLPGQYTVELIPAENAIIGIGEVKMFYDGNLTLDEFTSVSGNSININRTAQVTGKSRITLEISLDCENPCSGEINFRPALIY